MKSILIASIQQPACDAIRKCFASQYKVDAVSDRDSCLEKFRKKRYEFVFIELEILRGSRDGNEHTDYKGLLQPFWQAYPTAEIIVLSPQEMIREAVNAVKAGAGNYLTYPINPDEVKYVTDSISESIRMQSELDYLRDSFWQSDSLEAIRSNSPVMTTVFNKVRSVAPTKSTVLITGETGTGKGVLARLIHRHSNRADSQFISIHCGSIPDTLLESELFGHEKGAFTGAVRRKLGKFEIAQGGTIFLDEIGTITPSMQIKLLQILQERTFQRVGGEEIIDSDVRIITATNVDLKQMCDEGTFRNDLYYRLNVFPVELPPLRDRKEDLPLLVENFLRRLNKQHGKDIVDIHPRILEAFERYPWPGNIRELENLIERAYILESSPILMHESFPSELFTSEALRTRIPLDTSLTLAEARRRGIDDVERHYLEALLTLHRGRVNRTAEAAGVTSRQLHKLMTKHHIRKEPFR